MEEKKTLTSSDKLPGCERLTRPEEIKGLSKYLGAIKEAQEEWIEKNMPDEEGGKIGIEVDTIEELPDSVIGIDPTDIESIPDAVIGISDNTKVEVPKEADKLPNPIPKTKIIQDVSKLKVDKKITDLPKEISRIAVGEKEPTEITSYQVGIGGDIKEPTELPNSILSIGSDKEVELPRERLGIGDVIDNISLPVDFPQAPSEGKKEIDLPEGKEKIWPEEINKLPEGKDRIPTEIPNPNLPNERDRIPTKIFDPSLPGNKEQIPGEEKEVEIPAERLTIDPGKDRLNRGIEKRPGEEKDTRLPGDKLKRPAEDKPLKLPDILEKPDIDNKEIDEYVRSRKTSELYTDIIDALTIGHNGKIGAGETKLAGILSASLGKENMTPDELKGAAQSLFQYFQTQKALINAAIIDYPEKRNTTGPSQVNPDTIDITGNKIDRVSYKLPEKLFLEKGDPSTYIRQLAELATYGESGQGWWEGGNSGLSGLGRRTLLDTTLKALVATRGWTEKKLGINRDRLPGESNDFAEVTGKIVGAIKGGINTAEGLISSGNVVRAVGGIGNIIDSFKKQDNGVEDAQRYVADNPTPLNRPGWRNKNIVDPEDGTWNERVNGSGIEITRALPIKATGLELTLEDLCPESKTTITTIDEFKDALAKSPYMTSPHKYIKAKGAKGGSMTLDTNAYWEVVIEPLCKKSLNGGWSFLPHIHEINAENLVEHGVNTHYDKWIPLSNIELQKSKLTSKSLGLFDGEISYPVSVEYTNELRMTVIDDQYKSWRRYFQKVADVSVYSSEAHNEEWYTKRNSSENNNHLVRPTAIDKDKFCIAYYKNVAFNIKVYFMTPQFSTIKKFDLLCVLKDFTEEYYGEIEGGGQDLNISFSIVGENPDDNNLQYKIDSKGVGAWAYTKGENDVVYIGTDVNQSILDSEKIRSFREDLAAGNPINLPEIEVEVDGEKLIFDPDSGNILPVATT